MESLVDIERFEEQAAFIKIKRKNRRKKNPKQTEAQEFQDQVFGSCHSIHDSKVHFDGNRLPREYKAARRPGIVLREPVAAEKFETRWAPCSTKLDRRNEQNTVFISEVSEGIDRDSVLLLQYAHFYTPKTLGQRIFTLSREKCDEIADKLSNIE